MIAAALVRQPADNLGDGLTTVELGAPDSRRARAQHAAYVRALAERGLAVTLLPALPAYPDAHFVEDTAVILPELAVIARPGAPARRGEEESVAARLGERFELVKITAPATLDGGDVLVCGRRILVGLGRRTNEAGVRQLATAVRRLGYEVRPVTLAAGLHLKSSVNRVDEETVIATAELADHEELAHLRRIVVPVEEGYAANVLRVNDALLVPEGFPRTAERLANLGAVLVLLDVSEFRKMDGGLTCLSLRF